MPETTIEIDGKRVNYIKAPHPITGVMKAGGIHECKGLLAENKERHRFGENKIYIFQDAVNDKFNTRIGLEFIISNYCLFCGEKL